MRQMYLLACLLLAFTALLQAQESREVPYRVVFDLTSNDSLDQRAVMRWVKGITQADPNAQVEVVMYGKGFELVMPERSRYVRDIEDVTKKGNVTFRVCEMALKNNNVPRDAILTAAGTVPDGIREIILKQNEGWGYIKVAH